MLPVIRKLCLDSLQTSPVFAKSQHVQITATAIIANWKVLYRKRMLHYVFSQVDGEKNVSEIVKSINFLMAIQWGRQGWNDLCQNTITKCFQKPGFEVRSEK